jgi:hypothetical protein
MTDEPDDWLDKDDDQWRAKRKVNQPKVSLAYITPEQVRINCIHEPPCAHCWTCRLADQMDADEQRHQKEIVDAGELHLADESTIYQLEQRTKELEADLHDMCMEAVNYRIKHGEAKARCVELEAALRDEIAEGGDGPHYEYCWWCQRDVNGMSGKAAPHDPTCWLTRAKSLLARSAAGEEK